MDMPMSRAQLTEFIIAKELMNHFTLEQNLVDMIERGFLEGTNETTNDQNSTRFTLTEDGAMHLEQLDSLLPRPVRLMIDQYVEDNRGKIKKSFEKTANYFPSTENDEYIVKLGVYDDKRGSMLMEISMPVVTREQAKMVQSKWNRDYSEMYRKILQVMTEVG
jgi:hypothetical protein